MIRRAACRVGALACLLGPVASLEAGARVVFDASGTMVIRFGDPTVTPGGPIGPGVEYPFWWYGYQAPARVEQAVDAVDPALDAHALPIVHRFVYRGTLDGGYYDLFPYFGVTRLHSPFAKAWAVPIWTPWWRQPGSYDGPTLRGSMSKVDPSRLDQQTFAGPAYATPEPLPFQPTLVRLLRAGDYESALTMWRRARSGAPVEASGEPAYPGGEAPLVPVAIEGVRWTDSRLLAVAHAGMGRWDLAAESMGDAYLVEPRLASLPLDGDALAPDPRDLRRFVLAAIEHADEHPSADAWLLAATLTQVEGRDRVAAKFVARAAALGLDAAVAQAMYDALGGRPAPEGR